MTLLSVSTTFGISSAAHARDWICNGTEFWDNEACWSPIGLPIADETVNLGIDGAVIDYHNTLNPTDLLGTVRIDAYGPGTVRFEQTSGDSISISNLFVGRNSNGEYIQTAGTSNINTASIGGRTGSTGLFELGGSGEATFDFLFTGYEGSGTFNQTGGTNTVTRELTLGVGAGAIGNYRLSGGTLTVGDAVNRDGIEHVGWWGSGDFAQEAGSTHNVYGTLFISRKAGPLGAPSTGTYTMNGGILNADRVVVGSIPQVLTYGSNEYDDVHEASNGNFRQNDGEVTVLTDLVISGSGGALGRYELNGGSLTAGNVINNDRFEYSGGSLDSSIENHALLTFSGTDTLTVTGSITNVGETTYIQKDDGGLIVVYEETKNGVISVADGTRVRIFEDLTLGELGTLDIELGSNFLGFSDTVPWISVDGQVSIDGILNLKHLSGWSPVAGDSWTILEAATLTGMFDSVLFPEIPNWDWELVYEADRVLLSGNMNAVPLPAAVWLFASGIASLITIGRRRKT